MVDQTIDAGLAGAEGRAIDGVTVLDAVTDHRALAGLATWRQGVDRAFEGVENMRLTVVAGDDERLLITVAADFADGHDRVSSTVERA